MLFNMCVVRQKQRRRNKVFIYIVIYFVQMFHNIMNPAYIRLFPEQEIQVYKTCAVIYA